MSKNPTNHNGSSSSTTNFGALFWILLLFSIFNFYLGVMYMGTIAGILAILCGLTSKKGQMGLIRREAKKAMTKHKHPTVPILLSDPDLNISTPEGARKVLKYMQENGMADLDRKTQKLIRRTKYSSSSIRYAKVIISCISALLNFLNDQNVINLTELIKSIFEFF